MKRILLVLGIPILILIILNLASRSIIKEAHAIRALENAGYKKEDIGITERLSIPPHIFSGCGNGDFVAFKAKGLKEGTVTVCCGFFKNCTIRY